VAKPVDQPAPQARTLDGRRTVRGRRGRYGTAAGFSPRTSTRSRRSSSFCLAAIVGHAIGGAKDYSDQELAHGGHAVTALQYLGTSQFWFESFQNWQSEFLAVAVIVWASVYLRQRGSPESKPVAESHHDTGA